MPTVGWAENMTVGPLSILLPTTLQFLAGRINGSIVSTKQGNVRRGVFQDESPDSKQVGPHICVVSRVEYGRRNNETAEGQASH